MLNVDLGLGRVANVAFEYSTRTDSSGNRRGTAHHQRIVVVGRGSLVYSVVVTFDYFDICPITCISVTGQVAEKHYSKHRKYAKTVQLVQYLQQKVINIYTIK